MVWEYIRTDSTHMLKVAGDKCHVLVGLCSGSIGHPPHSSASPVELRLCTAESAGLSKKDSGVTLDKL